LRGKKLEGEGEEERDWVEEEVEGGDGGCGELLGTQAPRHPGT